MLTGKLIPLFLSALLCAQSNVLFYSRPAANWNEALPLGNGRLGAMVFGEVEHEHLQLNESGVWVGHRFDRNNPAGYEGFLEARRLLSEGKIAEALAVTARLRPATDRMRRASRRSNRAARRSP